MVDAGSVCPIEIKYMEIVSGNPAKNAGKKSSSL